jgi:hypothetical protein
MRLFVSIAAAALLATPAAAQRLDTRRIDLREAGDRTICSFEAYPQMMLVDPGEAGRDKAATWAGASAENADALMQMAWEPAKVSWRTPPFRGVAFTIPADPTLSRDTVASAGLIIDDGKPIPLAYNASGNKLFFVANRDTDNIGARIIGSDSVVLEVLDSAGTSLRRYSWNTTRLADAVETVSVVGWSCTTP